VHKRSDRDHDFVDTRNEVIEIDEQDEEGTSNMKLLYQHE